MALRKIESITSNETLKHATVYRDAEWDEYVVRFYTNGAYHEGADYHTDTEQDAQFTARSWTKKTI